MHTIYAVLGVRIGEGADSRTLQLFTEKSTAREYGRDLVRFDRFDYFAIETRTFCTE